MVLFKVVGYTSSQQGEEHHTCFQIIYVYDHLIWGHKNSLVLSFKKPKASDISTNVEAIQ